MHHLSPRAESVPIRYLAVTISLCSAEVIACNPCYVCDNTSMPQSVNVSAAGMELCINDVDDEYIAQGVTIPAIPAAVVPIDKKARGRARLHTVCPLHGASLSGDSCAKFSHLPGKGRGPEQPGVFRFVRVLFRAAAKPVGILAFCGFVGWLAISQVGGILGGSLFGGFVPTVPTIGTVTEPIPGTVTEPIPSTITGTGESANGGTVARPDSTNTSSGVKPDCFVPGNPCNLVLPPTVGK